MNKFKWGVGAAGLILAGGIVAGAGGLVAGVAAQEPPPGEQRLEQPKRERLREALAERPALVKALKNVVRAAAEIVDVEPKELLRELRSGKSLTAIAGEHGVSRDRLRSELFTALSTQLTQAVADGKITEERKTAVLNQLNERLDEIIDRTHDGGRLGPRGGGKTP